MKKIMTAMGEVYLNKKLNKEKDIKIVFKDIQYREAVIELIKKNKNIDFLIMDENISGEINFNDFLLQIKKINKKINIIIFLKKENYYKIKEKNIIKIIKKNKREDYNNLLNIILKNKKDNINEKLIKKEKAKINDKIIKKEKANINEKLIKKEKAKLNDKLIKKDKININDKLIKTNKKNNNLKIKNKKININKFKKNNNEKNNKKIISIFGINELEKNKFCINLKNNLNDKNKKVEIFMVEEIIKQDLDLKSKIKLFYKLFNQKKKKCQILIINVSSKCNLQLRRKIYNLSQERICLIESNLLGIKAGREYIYKLKKEDRKKERSLNIVVKKPEKEEISLEIVKDIFNGIANVSNFDKRNFYKKYINKILRSD